MKINVVLETESNEKLNVLLKMAYEMGMHVRIGDTDLTPGEDAELRATDNNHLQHLKAAVHGEYISQQKINLLTDAAKSIGIELEPVADTRMAETHY